MNDFPGLDRGGAANAVHATILVCVTCRQADGADATPRPGQMLYEATRAAAGPDVRVAPVECLANCKRRLSAAILRTGAWSYVFGDLALENAADLVSGARLYAAASESVMPWRGRPDCLKRGLVSRLPPFDLLTERTP